MKFLNFFFLHIAVFIISGDILCHTATKHHLQIADVLKPNHSHSLSHAATAHSPIHNAATTQSDTPKISIITSVYKGEKFIKGFMEDIIRQTIFNECELIIINANSPENEGPIIKKYASRYKNIRYLKLETDPGLYAVWNMAVKMARGQFLTNANVDDRLAHNCYEIHHQRLLEHPEIDLVYSPCFLTYKANDTFNANADLSVLYCPEFSKEELKTVCMPNNHPMWRKSLHDRYGLFDEQYKIAGDWDMWLRAVENGSVFMKINQVLGLYYVNPQGLSTDPSKDAVKEAEMVSEKYKMICLNIH